MVETTSTVLGMMSSLDLTKLEMRLWAREGKTKPYFDRTNQEPPRRVLGLKKYCDC